MKWGLLICAIVLVLGALKLSKKEVERIKESSLVTVVGSSELADYESEEKCCFSIEVEEKNKRKGYTLIKRKFETIRRHLYSKALIPDTNMLRPSKSEVRMNHHRKLWSFKRIICFLVENKQGQIKGILQRQGIKHINFHPTQELSQYDYFTKAFIDAKKKVEELLDEIEYRVKRVKSVRVLGDTAGLEEYHQSLYSMVDTEESSKSDEEKSKDKSQDKSDDQSESEDEDVRHIELEVVFQVESLDQYQNRSGDELDQSGKQSVNEMNQQL